jgi:hypothetical protein
MGVNIAIYGPRCGAVPGTKVADFIAAYCSLLLFRNLCCTEFFVSDYFCGVSQQGRLMELSFTTFREHLGCQNALFITASRPYQNLPT